MKPLLFLLLAGCTFGQNSIIDNQGQMDHVTVSGSSTDGMCLVLEKGKCLVTAADNAKCSDWRIDKGKVTYLCPKPAPKKPSCTYSGIEVSGDLRTNCAPKPAKPPFQCDHSKLRSCASQANDDYGPGRSGLVGEISSDGGGVAEPIPNQPMIDALNRAEGTEPVCQRNVKPCDSRGPIDVPAIQEDYVSAKKGGSCPTMNGMLCYYNEDQHDKRWTCKDKTRGLWHDEQEAPKYYCHRVQP